MSHSSIGGRHATGPAVFLQDLQERGQDATHRQYMLDALRRLEDEPSVMGVTGHIAAVGIKPPLKTGVHRA